MSRTAEWTVQLCAPPDSQIEGSIRKRSTNYHEYDRKRQKQRRDALRKDDSEAAKIKKEIEKEAARIRQQRRRQKLKEQRAMSQEKKHFEQAKNTAPESRKAYFREYRRKWRASISKEKQQAIKEKDRQKYRKKRQNKSLKQEQSRDLDTAFIEQSMDEDTETQRESEVYHIIHVKEESPDDAEFDYRMELCKQETKQRRKSDTASEEQMLDENTERQQESRVCHIHIKEESPDLAFPNIVESNYIIDVHKPVEQKQGRNSDASTSGHVQVEQMVSKLAKYQRKKYLEQVLCKQKERQGL